MKVYLFPIRGDHYIHLFLPPFWKVHLNLKKRLCCLWEQIISIKVDPFSEGDWCAGKQTGSNKIAKKNLPGLSIPFKFRLKICFLCTHPGWLRFIVWFIDVHAEKVQLGPVVQSVVSLKSSLRVISLTVLVDSIYNILIFFAEKMWVAFALQKLLTFFQQKISAYLRITRCKF